MEPFIDSSLCSICESDLTKIMNFTADSKIGAKQCTLHTLSLRWRARCTPAATGSRRDGGVAVNRSPRGPTPPARSPAAHGTATLSTRGVAAYARTRRDGPCAHAPRRQARAENDPALTIGIPREDGLGGLARERWAGGDDMA